LAFLMKVSQQNSEGTFCFNKHEKYTNTRNYFILKIHTLYEVYKQITAKNGFFLVKER